MDHFQCGESLHEIRKSDPKFSVVAGQLIPLVRGQANPLDRTFAVASGVVRAGDQRIVELHQDREALHPLQTADIDHSIARGHINTIYKSVICTCFVGRGQGIVEGQNVGTFVVDHGGHYGGHGQEFADHRRADVGLFSERDAFSHP